MTARQCDLRELMTATAVELASLEAARERLLIGLRSRPHLGHTNAPYQLEAMNRGIAGLRDELVREASEGVADASKNDLVGGHAQVGTPSLASSTETANAPERMSLDGSSRSGA